MRNYHGGPPNDDFPKSDPAAGTERNSSSVGGFLRESSVPRMCGLMTILSEIPKSDSIRYFP